MPDDALRDHARTLAETASPVSPATAARLRALLFSDSDSPVVKKPPPVRLDLSVDGVAGVDTRSALEDQARAAWLLARQVADAREFRPQKQQGRPGRVGPMHMSEVYRRLFSRADPNTLVHLSGLVGQVLKKAGMAQCLNARRGGPSTWWVADSASRDLVAVAVHVKAQGMTPGSYQGAEQTWAERRVTPQEAGEDRMPEPVQTTRGGTPAQQEQRERFTRTARERRDAFAQRRQVFLDVLRDSEQPLSVFEVAWMGAVLLGEKLPERSKGTTYGPTSMVRDLLKAEVAAGRVFARQETREERTLRFEPGSVPRATRADLFSLTNPVPPRTVGQVDPGIPMLTNGAPGGRPKKKRDPEPPPPPPADTSGDEQLVLDALSARNRGMYVAGSSLDSLTAVTGLPEPRVRVALQHLKDRGRVFFARRAARWSLEEWRHRSHKDDLDPPHPPDAPDTAPLPAYVNDAPAEAPAAHTEAPAATDDPNDKASQIAVLARELAVLASQPGDPAEEELLRAELVRVEEENAKLKRQVAGLKQALAAME